MLVRGESLAASMSRYLIDDIGRTPNIHGGVPVVRRGSSRREPTWKASPSSAKLPARSEWCDATALFVFIGAQPRTDWLEGIVERDEHGFIVTGPDLLRDGKPPKGWTLDRDPGLLETSVPGIFAVGDVRHGSVKRVASGVGEGSIAIQFVHQYLSKV